MSGSQAVLDMMTASVIERKVKAGAKLTPVGLEATKAAPSALPHTTASFPDDVPDEAILSRVAILEDLFAKIAAADEQQEEWRRAIHVQYAAIRQAMDAVKAALGQAPVEPPAEAQKAKEQAADARHAARQAEAADDAELPEPVEVQAQAEAAAALATIAAASTTTEKDAAVVEFVAQFEAKSAAAQAATFAQHPPAAPASAWVCPVHRLSIEKVSRLGRTYRACNEASCKEFEKL